jgi:hypothetical protein
MTAKEAIRRIEDHNRIHAVKEYPFAIKITEALDMAVKALEKQIPKKPKILTWPLLTEAGWKHGCPNCGCAVGENKNLGFAYGEYLEPNEDFCCSCGQALDWGDTE